MYATLSDNDVKFAILDYSAIVIAILKLDIESKYRRTVFSSFPASFEKIGLYSQCFWLLFI